MSKIWGLLRKNDIPHRSFVQLVQLALAFTLASSPPSAAADLDLLRGCLLAAVFFAVVEVAAAALAAVGPVVLALGCEALDIDDAVVEPRDVGAAAAAVPLIVVLGETRTLGTAADAPLALDEVVKDDKPEFGRLFVRPAPPLALPGLELWLFGAAAPPSASAS